MNIVFNEEAAYIVIATLAITGVIINALKNVAYAVFVKASSDVKMTQNRYVKAFASGMASGHRDNMDSYVEKCMYHMRFIKISLYSWDKLCVIGNVILTMLSFIICTFAYYSKKSEEIIVALILYSLLAVLILLVVSIAFSSYDKERCIRANLTDYFEMLKGNLKEKEMSVQKSENVINKENVTNKENVAAKEEVKDKKIADAIYQAAIEKMALEYTKNRAFNKNNENIKNDKNENDVKEQDKKGCDEAASKLVESIIKEMLQ